MSRWDGEDPDCGRCGHPKSEHIPQKDGPDCNTYLGECNLCSRCSQFTTIKEIEAEVARKNQEDHDRQRLTMTEYRITFGWSQVNGPGDPRFPGGFYTTVWAPDSLAAQRMAFRRYAGRFALFYSPDKWKAWGPEMAQCKELEVLQFYENTLMPEYPNPSLQYEGAVLGNGV